MIKTSVFYPSGRGKLDLDYYMNKHIPLCLKLLGPYGLIRIGVDKGIDSPEGAAPYVVIAHLVFESAEQMQKGMEAHDPELAADVKNYTDIQPIFQISEVLSG
ncbi:MAG: EthD family reductase [Deltaproteobacteria bacterium]|nr:EthD family reductase [Deltaproteobacteria bacterium]